MRVRLDDRHGRQPDCRLWPVSDRELADDREPESDGQFKPVAEPEPDRQPWPDRQPEPDWQPEPDCHQPVPFEDHNPIQEPEFNADQVTEPVPISESVEVAYSDAKAGRLLRSGLARAARLKGSPPRHRYLLDLGLEHSQIAAGHGQRIGQRASHL
jgi:hypothetical protein